MIASGDYVFTASVTVGNRLSVPVIIARIRPRWFAATLEKFPHVTGYGSTRRRAGEDACRRYCESIGGTRGAPRALADP